MSAIQNPRSREWYRSVYRDASSSGVVAAASAGASNVVPVPDANSTLYVQSVTISITTSAAQTITVQDSAGTPVAIAVVPASATGPFRVDFGPKGFGVTQGKQINIAGTAGPAYAYSFEAYAFPSAVIAATTVNRTF